MTNLGHDHFGFFRNFTAGFMDCDKLYSKAEANANGNFLKAMNYLGRAYKKIQKLDSSNDKDKFIKKLNALSSQIMSKVGDKKLALLKKMNQSAKEYYKNQKNNIASANSGDEKIINKSKSVFSFSNNNLEENNNINLCVRP